MTPSNSLTQAAIVLNSLPPSQAAQLLAKLAPSDVKSVLGVATELDRTTANEVTECFEKLSADWESQASRSDRKEAFELEQAKLRIDKTLSVVPRDISESSWKHNPFEFLSDELPLVRNHLLADEHPRNIAIVLSMLSPVVASATMARLDRNLRISVLKRMCELDEIRDDEVTELVYELRMRLNRLLNSNVGRSVGFESATNLLSCSDAATREALLAHVSQSDPDLASTLERSVFGIERLCGFTNSDIQVVLKNMDTSCWAPALKNASTDLKTKILNNMANVPRRLLSHEIDEIGNVDQAQEDAARKSIVNEVMRLAREGKVNVQSRIRGPHIAFTGNSQGFKANRSGMVLGELSSGVSPVNSRSA